MHANGNRSDAIYLVILGFMASLLLGLGSEIASPTAMMDFKVVYYGSRSIVHHVDPYANSNVLRVYLDEGNPAPTDPMKLRVFMGVMAWCVYPPTALIFFLPLSLLPFGLAHVIWLTMVIVSFALSFLLVLNLAYEFAPQVSGLLLGLIAANNVLVIASGNPAGLIVNLCVIATWCFVRQRYMWVGALCLALALGVKPHDAVWVWLFFFLASPQYRRQALKSAFIFLIWGLPAVVWVWHLAPHWLPEMRSNIAAVALPGGLCDPHMAAEGHYAVNQLITLQSLFSFFKNDSAFYNLATYLVCVPLLLIWCWITFRSRTSTAKTWFALASLLPIAMLPVYHRPYDAKLFMLMVPACAMLWAEGKTIGKIAAGLTIATISLLGDIPWLFLQIWGDYRQFSDGSWAQRILVYIWVFPVPLILLVTGSFYLFVYARRVSSFGTQAVDEKTLVAQ